MAEIRAQLKRAFLQSLADAVASATAKTDLASSTSRQDPPIVNLLEALKAFQRMGFNALKGGKLSMGSSGFGHDVRWAPPANWRAYSQESIMEMAQEFREVYNASVQVLVSMGTAEPFSDDAILEIMMASDELQSVTSLQKDYTLLRWNARY